MNLKSQLRNSYPNIIDKTKEIFSALVVNDKETAALQSALNDLIVYMKGWYSTPSLYEQTGEQFDRTVACFSYLTKFTDETEKSLKNRISAIFIRNHDKAWGSKYNIQRIFEQYFPSGHIYIVENSYPIEDSILKEGDFVSADLTYWSVNNVEIDKRARFSKTFGAVLLDENSELIQTVDVNNHSDSAYFLHFFCLGKCSVEITDNNGRFWNNNQKIWQETSSDMSFESDDWSDCDMWFTNFSEGLSRAVDDSISTVTVKFKGNSENECYIDYVRLFEKHPYPSFSVIAQFTSSNTFGSLGLFPGEDDPVEGETPKSYENAGYYNGVYMSGVAAGFAQDIYQDLLNYVRATGVKANIEIVSKDID